MIGAESGGRGAGARGRAARGLLVAAAALAAGAASGAEWPQYRGPGSDGISTERIATAWATNSPSFLVWTNASLTNGFSSFAVAGGRAFTQISRGAGTSRQEYCAAVDAASGTNLWATAIGSASNWNPAATSFGGDGNSPCNTGDGPRTTPSVRGDRVYALSGLMSLVCMNVTNGAVVWSNNLPAAYGATRPTWENGASPRLDGDLIFVNLGAASSGGTLRAFGVTNGAVAWDSGIVEEQVHATPTVATIAGVRQVIFATPSNLVSLARDTGALLWRYPYPFPQVDTAMGASPVAYSNLVFLTTAYASGRGGAAARVDYSNGAWTVTHLWTTSAWGSVTCQSTWMTPVCRDGYLYGQFGDKSYTNSPLNCIELATGRLMWSANHFGMGGVTLVGTNLLVVTEYGHLVLARADPSAYTELARYRAFQFTTTARGKCWNSAAVSDGRIYLRSTRGGLSVNVASPELPQLRMLPLQWVGPAQLQVAVGTVDGSAIDSNRLAGIQLRATNSMAPPVSSWPVVTNALRLSPDGVARATNAVPAGVGRQFYMTSEPP